MAAKPKWQRVAGVGLVALGVILAFATAAAGMPFWVVFAALLVSWLGVWSAGR